MGANRAVSKSASIFAGMLAACIATGAVAEYRPRASSGEIALVRNICIEVMRIRPGFVPFDACVESLSETLKQKGSSLMVSKGTEASYAIGVPEQTSYSQSNPEERHRKEEYACARMGLVPGASGFGQCVAQLDSALRSTEHSD